MREKMYIAKVLTICSFLFICVDSYGFFGKFKKNKNTDEIVLATDTLALTDDATDFDAPATLPPLDTANYNAIYERYNKQYEDVPLDSTTQIPDDFDFIYDKLMQTWIVLQGEKTECQPDPTKTNAPDSVLKMGLAKLPHIIEMPYNNVVRSMMDVYLVKRRSQVEYMLGVSEYYFPIFEKALAENDLPLELKYLPVIESALNPNAISHMGAAGLWQFMIGTGKMYGLEINSLIDERLDPIKSTNAAVRFLKDLYGIYGDWNLAIAAYNCGPGNVNKAIRRAGGQKDFWKIYPYLPRETRGYVPIFIAANYIMNYADKHNICAATVDMPILTDTIMITNRIHFEQIAAILDIPVGQIRVLNPQYRRDVVPGDIKPYGICLPMNHCLAYIDKCDDIAAYKADELINNRRKEVEVYRTSAPGGSGNLVYYKVKNGDTLGGIASRHGVSINKLKSWNNIKGTMIYAGQKLKIYK